MVKEDKASLYLVAMVGVVAAVGILILLANSGTFSITGQAYQAPQMKDPPGWSDYMIFLEKEGFTIPLDKPLTSTALKPDQLSKGSWYIVANVDDITLSYHKLDAANYKKIKKLVTGITPLAIKDQLTVEMFTQAGIDNYHMGLVSIDSTGKMMVYSVLIAL